MYYNSFPLINKSFSERSGENTLYPFLINKKTNLFPFLKSLSKFLIKRKIFFELRITYPNMRGFCPLPYYISKEEKGKNLGKK